MSETPPRRINVSTLRAPASMLFSINSFTTEAGRSTTSPAATWLATVSGNNRIRLIFVRIVDSVALIAKKNPCHAFFDLVRRSRIFLA
jgi:hypothetical protein